eukprot:TRINITY_DN4776_c0_g1_i1.p2 TRINITY_DN4776_c0_g1~~TRINITY_DN4776_c0_g1_i1.p2  ORF type:complete len:165 (-),score=28.00 TRINITY_DN4776_c0_g1_i1:290-784(-)
MSFNRVRGEMNNKPATTVQSNLVMERTFTSGWIRGPNKGKKGYLCSIHIRVTTNFLQFSASAEMKQKSKPKRTEGKFLLSLVWVEGKPKENLYDIVGPETVIHLVMDQATTDWIHELLNYLKQVVMLPSGKVLKQINFPLSSWFGFHSIRSVHLSYGWEINVHL